MYVFRISYSYSPIGNYNSTELRRARNHTLGLPLFGMRCGCALVCVQGACWRLRAVATNAMAAPVLPGRFAERVFVTNRGGCSVNAQHNRISFVRVSHPEKKSENQAANTLFLWVSYSSFRKRTERRMREPTYTQKYERSFKTCIFCA